MVSMVVTGFFAQCITLVMMVINDNFKSFIALSGVNDVTAPSLLCVSIGQNDAIVLSRPTSFWFYIASVMFDYYCRESHPVCTSLAGSWIL